MKIQDPDYWRKSAKSHADTISKILWAGLMLAITVDMLRLCGKGTVKFQDVDIPVDLAWIPFAALTLLHGLATFEFVRAARRHWELTEPDVYSRLFVDITTEGGYFMRNMTPRILPSTGGPAPMGSELATWLTHGAGIAFLVAMIPSTGFTSIQALPAYILTYANWLIGSRWAIALSELAVCKEYSTILAKRLRSQRTPTLFDTPSENTPVVKDSNQDEETG